MNALTITIKYLLVHIFTNCLLSFIIFEGFVNHDILTLLYISHLFVDMLFFNHFFQET